MHGIAYNQILILVLQCIIVGSLLLTLFRLRSIFGLSLLFIALGVIQYMQVFLYNTLYIEIAPSVLVSPGTILFTGSLFAILLIYIREDALEARKLIYAIVAANFVLVLLQYIISWKTEGEGILNIYHFPKELFVQQTRITLVGTFALLVDVFMIIFMYEIISKFLSSLFLRIFFSMALVLSIDSLLFNLGVYYGTDQFLYSLVSHLIAKISLAFVYSSLFTFYLIYLDRKTIISESKENTYNDIFNTLTFRQKFEKISKEREQISQELIVSKNYLQTIFDGTTDAIFIHDGETGIISDVNQSMCNMFGYTKEEVLHKTMDAFSSGDPNYTEKDAIDWILSAKNNGTQTFEWQARHKNDTIFWAEVSLKFISLNGEDKCLATVRNIEERKEAENKQHKSNRLLEIISQMSLAASSIKSEKILLQKFCDIIIETGKFKLAWIGFINEEKQQISPYVSAGDTINYLTNFKIDLADKTQSKGPTVRAIIKKSSVVFNDLRDNSEFKPWSDKAKKHGLKSLVSIPIITNDKVLGALNIYASEPFFFDNAEIDLLEKTSFIISLSLAKIHQENSRKQAEVSLQKSENRYRYFVEQTSEGFYHIESEVPIPINIAPKEQIKLMYKHMFVSECNDTYAKLYGYKQAKDIIGKRFVELHGNENDIDNINALTSFIASNYKVINATTKEITAKGEIRYFSNNAVGIIEDNCMVAFWGTQLDITHQKEIEAKLQESYQIINRSPAVAFLWKNEEGWPVPYVSENVQELTEYSMNDFLTQKISYFNIIHKDDIERVTHEVATYSEDKIATSFSHKPYRIVTKSGKIKWVNDNSVIRRNENNDITHFEGLVIDITENKLAEEKIIESERKLREAQKIAHLGHWELNLITNKLKWSDEVYRIFGLKPQEFDATYEAFLENIHPDDREKVNTSYLNSLKSNIPYEIEHRLLLKSGQLKYVIEKGRTVFDKNGMPQSSTGTVYDITKLKKVEEEILVERNKAQQYLEVAGIMLLSLNGNGIVELINPKGCQILGYPQKDILGKNWFDNFIPKKQRAKIKEASKKVFSGELASVKHYENAILTKSGEERLIAWQNELIKDASGKITGVLSSGEDITERKKDEELLKRSEHILNETQKISKIGGWEYDVESDESYFSEEVYNIYGIAKNEMIKPEEGTKFYHPDYRPLISDSFTKAISDGIPYDIEARFINAQGKNMWIRAAGKPISENGKIVKILGSLMDITERKETEEKIQKSSKFIFNTLKNMTDGYVSLNTNWEYTNVNQRAGNLFRRSPEDLIGKNIWKEFPDGVNQPFYKNYYKAATTQNEIIFEDYYPPWNKWFENRIIPSKEGLAIFFQDITERKLSQKSLQNYANRVKLLYNIDKSILAADSPKIIAANVFKELKQLIPYKLASFGLYDIATNSFNRIELVAEFEIKNKEITHSFVNEYDLVDLPLLKSGKIQLINHLETNKTSSEIFKDLINHNVTAVILVPLMIEGKLMGLLNIATDNATYFSEENIQIIKEIASQLAISIQQCKLREEILAYTKELESKVEERTKELEHSNRELRDFAQIVSHDLKAPLRAISQLSYWLSQDYADKIDEEGQKQLTLLIARVQRLDNLIEGILQFSRIGKASEKEVIINLNNLVEDTIELLDSPENIHIKIDTKLPTITADPTRIGQLFQNLIQNAIKFIDKPTGFINIGVIERDHFYEFYVKDNGCGIDEQYFDRIFKIFQRLVSRDEQEGTGIGLSLVKRIAQIYGGDVWLTSKVREGTTFYFTFAKNKENN